MATKSKYPAQLYVVAKKQPIYDAGQVIGYDPPLGFLNAYELNKTTFAKKRATQEEWAYRGYMHDFKLEQRGPKDHPEYWITGKEYTSRAGSINGIGIVDKFADPQPQIWDNTPTSGFKIEKSISRISGNNKLWRILDPRGIEFEITTGCLEQIINDAGILKGGEIAANCVWMSNKNLIVVP